MTTTTAFSMTAQEAADAGKVIPGTNAFGSYLRACRLRDELNALGTGTYDFRYEAQRGGCLSSDSSMLAVVRVAD